MVAFPKVPILLCIYHVRKAWTSKLMEMVHIHETRIDMNLALEDLCYGSSLDGTDEDPYEPSARIKLRDFKERFCEEPLFIQYFQSEWEPCMGNCDSFPSLLIQTVINVFCVHNITVWKH